MAVTAIPGPSKKTYSGSITTVCGFCNGTGKVPDVLPQIDCKYCGGVGTINIGTIVLTED